MRKLQRASRPDPLTGHDTSRLFAAAAKGPLLFGLGPSGEIEWSLSGIERALLYRLIVECGLRLEEILALPASNVHLETVLPYIIPGPLASLSRQRSMLPLGGAIAAVLGELLQEKDDDEALFRTTDAVQVKKAIDFDAQAAGLGSAKMNAASLMAAFIDAGARMISQDVRIWSDRALEVRP